VKRTTCRYAKARDQIAAGDVLLFRPQRWALHSKLICVAGRSDYCHAAMVDWLSQVGHPSLQCLEMVATGGRSTSLARQVESYPGLIDLYALTIAPAERNRVRQRAVWMMRRMIQRPYGFCAMLRVAFRHLAFIRLFCKPETDDMLYTGRPPFCSQAIAAAYRFGRLDVVPRLSDSMTEPGDLARSSYFDYRFTLIP